MKKNLHFILTILFVLISLWCNAQPESNANLTVKVYIEGLYSGSGQMDSPILNSGINENAQNIDSLSLFLAEPQSPNTIVFSGRTMLQSNGIAEFNLPSTVVGNQYYLVIKHRNSLETWSKQPITFSESTYYNFAGIYQYPQVTTAVMNNILNTSANGGGNVLSDGGATVTNKGLVWSISPRPTIALTSKTLNGSGTGAFNSIINGLTANTTYYLRAYATNALGTAYGNEISFTTTNYPVDINGNIYDTVVIGTQTWFSKNLKVTNYRNGDPIPTGLSNLSWQSTTSGAYAIYNNSVINDSIYGKSYNWYAVADPRGLCPSGWHVPSDAEWSTLETTLGGSSVAGGAMKETDITHWASPNFGATNSSGFTGLPGGYRIPSGSYYGNASDGNWWSSSQSSTTTSFFRFLVYSSPFLFLGNESKNFGLSVRCLKGILPTLNTSSITNISNTIALGGGNVVNLGGDNVTSRGVVWSTSPNPTISLNTKTFNGSGIGGFTSNITGLSANTTYFIRAFATNSSGTAYGDEISFTTTNYPVDINGNIYDTVVIGTQTWLAKNLKVTHYRNGDPIPTGLSNLSWETTTSGAYAIYNGSAINDSEYGKLYNWYAVADPRGICPIGWHVPTDTEWTTLDTTLGGASVAGGKLKEIGITHWASPNTGATNSSGFTGLPGGNRYSDGTYGGLGTIGYWWSTLQSSAAIAYFRFMNYNVGSLGNTINGKTGGFSVRCIRDSLAKLNTSSISNLSNNSVTCGGNILSAGGSIITARGVVWSTSPNPTIALTTKTNDGNGVGLFTSSITGLTANTTYYLRAYASNAVGTSYGNEVSFTTPNYSVDINGNIYNTVVIGTQTWFAQNLKVANYRNGDPIPTGFTGSSWGATTSGAYAIYNNSVINDSVYGKLYNWYAVADSRGLCPVGWHVPSDAEWMTLESNLGMLFSDLSLTGGRGAVQNVGGKLKEAGLAHWISPNTGATNSNGFTGLPGGGRDASGSYFNIGTHAYWWSSSQFSNLTACMRDLFFLNSNVGRYTNDWGKSDGFSVRCVKD